MSGSAASYPLTVTATNGVGSPAGQSFTLTVNPPPATSPSGPHPAPSTVTAGSAAATAIGTAAIGIPQSVALSGQWRPRRSPGVVRPADGDVGWLRIDHDRHHLDHDPGPGPFTHHR